MPITSEHDKAYRQFLRVAVLYGGRDSKHKNVILKEIGGFN